eukprot:scaffold828_cov117-Amphora_coffeaeformis.AAC.8
MESRRNGRKTSIDRTIDIGDYMDTWRTEGHRTVYKVLLHVWILNRLHRLLLAILLFLDLSAMIFDVKMEANFRRKGRLVACGHQTESPEVPTYASVVSRDTVRIALTYAALNDLEVKDADIHNANLTAQCEEKIYTRLGPEFGPDQGKHAIITRALYGLKSAGASFNRHLADCMRHMGYKACKADPDLWIRMEQRPDDGLW